MEFILREVLNPNSKFKDIEIGRYGHLDSERPIIGKQDAKKDNVKALSLINDVVINQTPPIIFNYFITVAFPINHKFKIKHNEIKANGNCHIVFSDIRFGDCTFDEQYQFIMWKLRKNINLIAEHYDIFFETTKEGHIHFHGRINSHLKNKDIRLNIHRIFELPTKFKYFTDIKEYDATKWAEYDKKVSERKIHQTTNLPHFKNI